jgi:4-hydroxy-3-methylbut-2-enyl diphosphate reductase
MRLEAALIGPLVPAARVHRTGMGPVNARTAGALLGRPADGPLLVIGFCGGLDEHSVAGEVIVAEHVYGAADEGHSAEPVACPLAGELVVALAGRGMKIRSGPVVSVSRLALGERRAQLLADGALAVDMESLWLAQGAAHGEVGVVRVVLDSPRHELLRPGALIRGPQAALALRRVAAAVQEWLEAREPREI